MIIDLSFMPIHCVWWSVLVIYLLLSWLVVGPIFSRRIWNSSKGKKYLFEMTFAEGFLGAEGVWILAPIHWPFVVVGIVLWTVFGGALSWLIYGPADSNRSGTS